MGSSFKQQCPSCEAWVAIKDASLVGKKIECPKCKYRFLVNEPEDAGSEPKTAGKKATGKDAPAKAKAAKAEKAKGNAEGKKAAKKGEKKGSNQTLIIAGSAIGVVAVIVLIVVGILVMGGGDSSSSSSGTQTASRPSAPASGAAGQMRPIPGQDSSTPGSSQPNEGNAPPSGESKVAPDPSLAKATNLLPNDTQVVYSLNVPRFLASPIGNAAFRSASGYQLSMFRDGLGLPLEQIQQFVRAENLKHKWVFNVVQMSPTHQLQVETLKEKLGSQPGAKSPIKGHEYFLVKPNEVMDSLSGIGWTSIFNLSQDPPQVSGAPLAWHRFNDQILVITDVPRMEEFLNANRQPAILTQPTEGGGSPPPMAAGPGPGSPDVVAGGPGGSAIGVPGFAGGPGGPGGPGGMPAPPGGPGNIPLPTGGPAAATGGGGGIPLPQFGPAAATGGGSAPGPGTPPMQAPPPQSNNPAPAEVYTDRATYLTVPQDLKRILDRVEEARQPVIFSCAGIDLESVSGKMVEAIRTVTTLGAFIPLPTVTAAGLALHSFSEVDGALRVVGLAGIELKQEQDARSLDDKLHRDVLDRAARMLGKWMNTVFSTSGSGMPNVGSGRGSVASTSPGAGQGPGGFGPMMGMGGPMGGYGGDPRMMMGGGMMNRPGAGGFSAPTGAGPMMGGPMGGYAGDPRMMMGGGRPNAPAPGAARSGPAPGAALGPGGGDDGGDVATGGPGGGNAAGAPRIGGFGGAGSAGGSAEDEAAPSYLRSWSVGKVVLIGFDAEVLPDTDQKIRREVEQISMRLRGTTEVAAMMKPRWHQLAQTAVQIRGQNRILIGTFPTEDSQSGAVFVRRPPHTRVSWMAELLPFLGKAEIRANIDTKKPWRDPQNLAVATNWVPELLNPLNPRSSWVARLPSLPDYTLGATHYVGLAGIGLDAADLPNSPNFRNRLGLFGYDRPTNLDDVSDGLSSTIYMISVPPSVPRPWIAGGGATIQGVPETNSLAPFVSDHGGGKLGAYVLMADGSVRFLRHDTADAVFKALVTKAAGDDPGTLDSVAPIEPPSANVKPTPPPAGAALAPPKNDSKGN